MDRRGALKTTAALVGGALLGTKALNAHSSPSRLRITGLRVLTAGPGSCAIVRVDTNQDVYGLGEAGAAAGPASILSLKNHILGENPLSIDSLFEKIKPFGGPGPRGGGVSAIETALWDITGKVYGAPVWRLLGGKCRDRVRVYAGAEESPDSARYSRRMKRLREITGVTWLKIDLGFPQIAGIPGTLTRPSGMGGPEAQPVPHPFAATELTEKGIAMVCEHVAAVREAVGRDIPLSLGYLGPFGVNSCIRLGKALEQYNLSWMEDVIPWRYPEQLRRVTAESPVPTLSGGDIYLKEDFVRLCERRAANVLHPDPTRVGGILETRRIARAALACGAAVALGCAGTPVGCLAGVHCAAATENFLALASPSLDAPAWQGLVEGIDNTIINNGYITVPDKPGLGVTLHPDLA